MKHLVLIDDSADQLELMQLALAAMGTPPPLRIYTDGERAVEDLARGDVVPDLILIDINMPGLDGPATVRRLRRLPHLAHSAMLMLSTSDRPEDMARSREAGADDYLRKPHGGQNWRDVLTLVQQTSARLRRAPRQSPTP